MSFMPGDIKSGVPKLVEAEWILHSKEYTAWSKAHPVRKNTPLKMKKSMNNYGLQTLITYSA